MGLMDHTSPYSEIEKSRVINSIDWANRQPEPLTICNVTLWSGGCGPCDTCTVCKTSYHDAYEATFEWGDTKKYEYFSELCYNCLVKMFRCCENYKNNTKYS